MSDQARVDIFVSYCFAVSMIGFHFEEGFFSLSLGYRSGHCAFCKCMHQTLKRITSFFFDAVGVALQKVTSTESFVLLSNFNAHLGTDDKTWKGVIRRQGDFNINRNGGCLLQFCAIHGVCIMNIFFFGTKEFTKTLGTEIRWDSIIDFYIISADLFSCVVDDCAKRVAELSTDHHQVACILRDLNHSRTRKRFRAQKAYIIKVGVTSRKKGKT